MRRAVGAKCGLAGMNRKRGFTTLGALLCAAALLAPTAEAAISVNFSVPNEQPLVCTNAEDVRLMPTPSTSDVRFSFLCSEDGIQRSCQPATTASDPDIVPNGPFVKYMPGGSGASLTVVCDTATGAAPVSIKGIEVAGLSGDEPIVGCHPASDVTFEPGIPADSCVSGSGSSMSAACLRYRCPNDSDTRACFPIADLTYQPTLPDGDTALRRLTVLCESRVPLLSNGFGD